MEGRNARAAMNEHRDVRGQSFFVLSACATLLALATSLGTGQESASATPAPLTSRPFVSFTLQSSTEVHVVTVMHLCAHGVPRGYTSYLEQKAANARSWRFTVSFKVRGQACTTYRFREPVPGVDFFRVQLWNAGKLRYQTPVHTLTVFGHVSFVALCNEGLVVQGFLPNYCQTKTLHIGLAILTYLIVDAAGTEAPHHNVLIEVPRSTCNSVVVHMGVAGSTFSGASATMEIVESHLPRHSETVKRCV